MIILQIRPATRAAKIRSKRTQSKEGTLGARARCGERDAMAERSLLTRTRNGGRRYRRRTHLPRGRPAASEFFVAAVRSSTAVHPPSQSPGRVVFRSAIWRVEPPVAFSGTRHRSRFVEMYFRKRIVAAMAHFRTIVICPRRL
jgi:hypothetical protein